MIVSFLCFCSVGLGDTTAVGAWMYIIDRLCPVDAAPCFGTRYVILLLLLLLLLINSFNYHHRHAYTCTEPSADNHTNQMGNEFYCSTLVRITKTGVFKPAHRAGCLRYTNAIILTSSIMPHALTTFQDCRSFSRCSSAGVFVFNCRA